jgi:uncharacterized protein YaiL (DUF2058 family)
MSMSLRDQLLQAGLVSKQQVKDAERQQERQARQQPKGKRAPVATPERVAPRDAGKAARDRGLDRGRQENAKKKELLAQIKQLIEPNRLPPIESDDFYNFVDGSKIRHVPVNASIRAGLVRGDIAIVRYAGGYDLVPAAIGARIRERDASAVIANAARDDARVEDVYAGFAVPDDLIW